MKYQDLKEQIKRHEGTVRDNLGRHVVYTCPAGHQTVGWGRNLEGRGLSDYEANILLENDLSDAGDELLKAFPWMNDISQIRFYAFVNLSFNMGLPTLKTFKRMLSAAEDGDWLSASRELMDSRYARQVGARAVELADQIETGEWQR